MKIPTLSVSLLFVAAFAASAMAEVWDVPGEVPEMIKSPSRDLALRATNRKAPPAAQLKGTAPALFEAEAKCDAVSRMRNPVASQPKSNKLLAKR